MATALMDTDLTCEITLENLFDRPEGRRVLTYIQCGTCAATCPYGEQMEYPARRIISAMRAGVLDQVFASDSLLACVACYACKAKCPRKIGLTGVLLPLVRGAGCNRAVAGGVQHAETPLGARL